MSYSTVFYYPLVRTASIVINDCRDRPFLNDRLRPIVPAFCTIQNDKRKVVIDDQDTLKAMILGRKKHYIMK